VVDGAVVARPLVAATLAADHRASDGHVGGQLLAAIDAALQSPETL
jgi:pyruvate dehydrogenase E2 component (dihydrolipoamide acetyltransferase)